MEPTTLVGLDVHKGTTSVASPSLVAAASWAKGSLSSGLRRADLGAAGRLRPGCIMDLRISSMERWTPTAPGWAWASRCCGP
jgi:hypothetical protein